MPSFTPSAEQVRRFHQDGYLIVNDLFDAEEVSLLRRIARADQQMLAQVKGRRDGEGGVIQLSVQNEVGDGIAAAIVRCQRVVEPMEAFLGGEVYHYHHKMILKEPLLGGAWEWHQDYGYWYNNGCLFPDMGSCMIAVDAATKANGCLQVLKGSHLMGRIEHGKVGDQTGADPERVAAAVERLELVHCEMQPGSAVFFHANTLHRSDQNRSTEPRWALICCYNTARNDPYKDSHHPRYSKLERWADERVKEVGRAQWQEITAAQEPAVAGGVR